MGWYGHGRFQSTRPRGARLRRAVVDGATLDDFRKDFWRTVETRGWHGWTGEGTRTGEAWRTRVIYTTNTRKSFSAGRYAQLTDPAVAAVLPYWKWVHSGTAHDPRPEHLAWHGLTLHHTDPFWQSHFPPRIPPDWGCGCRVEAVRAPAAGAQTTPPPGWAESAAQPGAGVAPPADVVADIRQMVADKRARLPPALSRALGEVVNRYVIGSRGPLPAVPAAVVATSAAAAATASTASATTASAASAVPAAYLAASAGGEHAGLLARMRGEGKIQLDKAVRSYEKRIAEHEAWIAQPQIKLGAGYDPQEARRLVEKKWPKDIARLRAERDVIVGLLRMQEENNG